MISEETIKQWLLDEDMLLEMKYDESADFHFIIEFPKENIMDVVKPKDKDCIILACATFVFNYHSLKNIETDHSLFHLPVCQIYEVDNSSD